MEESHGKYILMVDADGATKFQDLEKLYTQIKAVEVYNSLVGGSMGMAIGSRYMQTKLYPSFLGFFNWLVLSYDFIMFTVHI